MSHYFQLILHFVCSDMQRCVKIDFVCYQKNFAVGNGVKGSDTNLTVKFPLNTQYVISAASRTKRKK